MIVVRGFGPYGVYWGVEEAEPGEALRDTSWVSQAWLVEDLPPYRRSIKALRLRYGRDRALHLGLCTYGTEPPHSPLEVSPNDIGSWGKKHVPQEDLTTDDEAGALEVRQSG